MTSPSHPLFALLEKRHSCRAFLEEAVPRAVLEEILQAARMSPSGANLQPGHFHVLTGAALAGFSDRLTRHADETPPEEPQYGYYPRPMPPLMKERQRAAGYALYNALGIGRRDLAARKAQFAANYRFFDAPVGIVVTIHPDMGHGCYLDLGMALMTLMLAAGSFGYATCGIGALGNYGRFIHTLLDLPQDEQVVCGVAIGRADTQAAANSFRTERAPLSHYATFHGFDGDDADGGENGL